MQHQCIVCYYNYDSVSKIPRILPCGHTFCQRCLFTLAQQDSYSNNQNSTIVCPQCRRAVSNLYNIDKLPANSNYFRSSYSIQNSKKYLGIKSQKKASSNNNIKKTSNITKLNNSGMHENQVNQQELDQTDIFQEGSITNDFHHHLEIQQQQLHNFD